MSASKNSLISLPKFLIILWAILLCGANCQPKQEFPANLNQAMPNKFLWAWERPEDLRFLDAGKFGAAFLAQTIELKNAEAVTHLRRQPLKVAPDVYLIAVTRIETDKQSDRAVFSAPQKEKVVFLIVKTLELSNVKAVQIDFDAVVSERDFYRDLVIELKKQLPEKTPLTMTALASWCVGDAWFADFPVDEAVPMTFEMGADDQQIRAFLANGGDWREPLCRHSYGIAVDEPMKINFQPHRRFFYFKSRAWEKSDVEKLD